MRSQRWRMPWCWMPAVQPAMRSSGRLRMCRPVASLRRWTGRRWRSRRTCTQHRRPCSRRARWRGSAPSLSSRPGTQQHLCTTQCQECPPPLSCMPCRQLQWSPVQGCHAEGEPHPAAAAHPGVAQRHVEGGRVRCARPPASERRHRAADAAREWAVGPSRAPPPTVLLRQVGRRVTQHGLLSTASVPAHDGARAPFCVLLNAQALMPTMCCRKQVVSPPGGGCARIQPRCSDRSCGCCGTRAACWQLRSRWALPSRIVHCSEGFTPAPGSQVHPEGIVT